MDPKLLRSDFVDRLEGRCGYNVECAELKSD